MSIDHPTPVMDREALAREIDRLRDALVRSRDEYMQLLTERDAEIEKLRIGSALAEQRADELSRLRRLLHDRSVELARAMLDLTNTRAELAEVVNAATRQAEELGGLRDELTSTQYHRDLMCAAAERAEQRRDEDRREHDVQVSRLRGQVADAVAGMRELAETIGTLTAERIDLRAMVERLEQLPDRWRVECDQYGLGYVAELQAAISGGKAWDDLGWDDGDEDHAR